MGTARRKNLLLRDENGYSFVELLVAITILAIVMLPFLSLFISGYAAMITAGKQTIASNLCREKIEEIKARGYYYYEDLIEAGGTGYHLIDEDPVAGAALFRRSTRLEIQAIPQWEDVLYIHIIVEVFWQGQNESTRSVQVESHLGRR